jgi:hypothetical protein
MSNKENVMEEYLSYVDSQVKEADIGFCKLERQVLSRNKKHPLRNAIHMPFGAKSLWLSFHRKSENNFLFQIK